MKIFFTLSLLTIVHWQCQAQFSDNFSDSDFTTNPTWTGDDVKFNVIANQLTLQAEAVTSSAYLSTSCPSINNASWEFLVQMGFNPSSTNYSKVYLVSDQPVLTGSLNGYFVKLGNTADEVSLYRQDGIKETKIIDGLDKILDTSTVLVKVKVTRDDVGNWQLFSDVTSSGLFTLEGNCFDTTYSASSYFGIFCKYTSTRSTKFHFDNFVVTGDAFADVIPPRIDQLNVISPTELEVHFSEKIENISAQILDNYTINNEVGSPSTAVLLPDQKTIHLTFNINFPNAVKCLLNVSGIKDLAGNTMITNEQTFQFFQPAETHWRDIVISEIFADPDPQISLPQAEFIELFNRSDNPIDLADFTITDGTSVGSLSSFILFPDQYIVLTTTSTASLFKNANVLGVSNFPTLNNSGDELILKNADGFTIDSLLYSDKWYRDDDKKNGGWSLERIDLNNICTEDENWVASEDESGGTPGKQNSVNANKPDLTGPKLMSVLPSENSILLFFNEKLENRIPSIESFLFDPLFSLTKVSFDNSSLTVLKLESNASLENKVEYSITVNQVYDCAGNDIQQDFSKLNFGLPEPADSLDLIINEILFNPKPTGVDFVEIYNRSSKYIDLKNYSLANFEDEIVTHIKPITLSNFLLKPKDYLVFATSSNILKSEFPQTQLENVFEVSALPSLNDDEGSITLISDQLKIIDEFNYSKSMHSVFINAEEGVSLERIEVDAPTNESQNWKSASSVAGFATPGFINSNSKEESSINSESIKVDPEIFIPAYGQPNFTMINYNFDKGDFVGNVKIYDLEGREVKLIANNEILGTKGFFRWDGDHNNGSKVPVGYYVVRFEIFNATGVARSFLKRVVVATRF